MCFSFPQQEPWMEWSVFLVRPSHIQAESIHSFLKNFMPSIMFKHALWKEWDRLHISSREYEKWHIESTKSRKYFMFSSLSLEAPQHIPNIHSVFLIQPSVTSLILHPPLPPCFEPLTSAVQWSEGMDLAKHQLECWPGGKVSQKCVFV